MHPKLLEDKMIILLSIPYLSIFSSVLHAARSELKFESKSALTASIDSSALAALLIEYAFERCERAHSFKRDGAAAGLADRRLQVL